jgi:transcriptional regulator with PAS, ATPase and Fis domain
MQTTAHPAIPSGEPRDLCTVLMENVSEAAFVIEPRTGHVLEANHQAANVLGYSMAELLALQTHHIFSSGTERLQHIPTANGVASHAGGTLVTKQGHSLWPIVATHTVAHRGRAAVLVIARDGGPTAPLAPSKPASAIVPDMAEWTAEPEEVIETTFTVPSIIGRSTPIRDVCRLIGLVAQTDTTVLIQGESGTGKELVGQAIRDGCFREDLYYRLNAFPIHLPPLRARQADIALLAHHFLTSYAAALHKPITAIAPEAITLLMDYAWPGNVRELENAIEYAVILETGPVLRAASFPDKLRPHATEEHPSLKARLALAERQIILEALHTCNGMKTRTAEFLGIDRRNLTYFLHKHGIQRPSLHA